MAQHTQGKGKARTRSHCTSATLGNVQAVVTMPHPCAMLMP